MNSTFIPARTREELARPAAPGERHQQMLRLASQLVWGGFNTDAIFYQLRPMYASDVSDREIMSVIRWALGKIPPRAHKTTWPCLCKSKPKVSPQDAVKSFLNGFTCSEVDIFHASPWRPLDDWRYDSLVLLAALFRENEGINIVTQFAERNEKASPAGYGKTMSRNHWMRQIAKNGAPSGRAGAWIRINPVDYNGISDKNVTAYRYALLEFDSIPLDLQLSLVAKLPLPICAVLTSGGRSLHAWVRFHAPCLKSYREIVREMLDILACFGADTANKNPSRLSRLVGVKRHIGATADGHQRLLYLNPDCSIDGTIL